MKCLIDGDVLLYELGFSGQYVDIDSGELEYMGFDFVADLLHQKVKEIEGECWATKPSTLYLTNNSTLQKIYSRYCKTHGLPCPEYKPNFREVLAVTKPYKGNRKSDKPFHYKNLMAYMLANFDVKIANGLEADDLICIDSLNSDYPTVICTRDKDLRMVEGLHFGWPCGKQPQFGVLEVKGLGKIEYVNKDIKGYGLKFFYSQLITGDKVDNIAGLPRGGAKMAYELLAEAETEQEMYEAVTAKYKEKLGEEWETYFEEQVNLLWMVRELDDKGEPVLWKPPIMNT